MQSRHGKTKSEGDGSRKQEGGNEECSRGMGRPRVKEMGPESRMGEAFILSMNVSGFDWLMFSSIILNWNSSAGEERRRR